MKGILHEITKTTSDVGFQILDTWKSSLNHELLLIGIDQRGMYIVRKLANGETIAEFKTSSLLIGNEGVYVLIEKLQSI